MRSALSGLLDGLLSRGGLLMPTRAWTLTLISLVMRRQKSPFPPTALESQPPRLRPTPLLRLLLLIPRLKSKPPCTILLVFFFFYLGLRTSDICNAVLGFETQWIPNFPSPHFFFHNCVSYAALSELTWIGGYMALSEQLSS